MIDGAGCHAMGKGGDIHHGYYDDGAREGLRANAFVPFEDRHDPVILIPVETSLKPEGGARPSAVHYHHGYAELSRGIIIERQPSGRSLTGVDTEIGFRELEGVQLRAASPLEAGAILRCATGAVRILNRSRVWIHGLLPFNDRETASAADITRFASRTRCDFARMSWTGIEMLIAATGPPLLA